MAELADTVATALEFIQSACVAVEGSKGHSSSRVITSKKGK